MRPPRAKSTIIRRTAAIHAKGPGVGATPNKSEFIAGKSASDTTSRRRPFGLTQRKKAAFPDALRSAANGENGKPEANQRRREEAQKPGAAQSISVLNPEYNNNDLATGVEGQEGGELVRPQEIIFRRAPSPYKSNPFRLAVALKVKYVNKFTDTVVTSRPRGCKYVHRVHHQVRVCGHETMSRVVVFL